MNLKLFLFEAYRALDGSNGLAQRLRQPIEIFNGAENRPYVGTNHQTGKLAMKSFALVLLLSLPLPWALSAVFQDQESESPKSPAVQEPIPVPDESSVERRDFMRTKLMYSQNIFEGLTIRDFDLINQGVRELEQVMEAEAWVTIDNDDYRELTREFKTAVQRLKISAETKNIEATALRFYELSTRCIDCHQHLRHARYHF